MHYRGSRLGTKYVLNVMGIPVCLNEGPCPLTRGNNSNSQSTSVILIKIFPITPGIISSKLGTNIKASLDLFGVFHPTLEFFTQMETPLVEKNLFVQIKNQTLFQSKIVKIH